MSGAEAWIEAAGLQARQDEVNKLIRAAGAVLFTDVVKADAVLALAHLVVTGALATDGGDPRSVIEAISLLALQRLDRHEAVASANALMSRAGRVN